MKHYSQMSDEEIGRDLYERLGDGPACSEMAAGATLRRMLDSMEPDELTEVRAEASRTAQAIRALAIPVEHGYVVGQLRALEDEMYRLIDLRTKQHQLEAKLAEQKGRTP